MWWCHLPQQASKHTGQSACCCPQNEAPLLTPDIVICSVGTEVFYRDSDGKYRPDTQWRLQLDAGGRWDRDKVQQVAQGYAHLTLQVRAAPPWAPLWLHLPWQQLAAT